MGNPYNKLGIDKRRMGMITDQKVFFSSRQIGTGLPLRGHSGPVQAVSVLAKEELVLSASHDSTMRAWRLSDFSCASIYR